MIKNPELNIKHYRELKGISQIKLAKNLSITQGYISKVEKGIESPTVRMLYRFAEALEVCPHVLLSHNKYCECDKKTLQY